MWDWCGTRHWVYYMYVELLKWILHNHRLILQSKMSGFVPSLCWQLWNELCELISKNPDKVKSLKVEAIIRQGIKRYSDQVGLLWNSLANYYIRSEHFEKVSDSGVSQLNATVYSSLCYSHCVTLPCGSLCYSHYGTLPCSSLWYLHCVTFPCSGLWYSHICSYVCGCVHVCVYMCVCMYLYVGVCMCICVCICMCICITVHLKHTM